MKRHLLYRCSILGIGIALLVWPTSAFAQLDQYIGDSAIYSASTQYLRPNVLLMIDNSNTASNTASGVAYDPAEPYSGGFSRYGIYQLKQNGDPENNPLENSTSALENLSCSNNDNIIRNTLISAGTYTGRASSDYPSIKNGGCDTGKAYTYALGNYLNYLSQPPPDGETLSQSQIVFDAINTVVAGSRYAVNFGSMVYNDTGNKGARIVTPVSDLSDDSNFQTFLNKLPGSGHDDAAGLLSSGTARPQAEALLDAGFYFRGQALPISGQSAMTSPISNTCDKNVIILITNGLSNKDDDGALASIVGDYDGDGAESSAYGLGTHYLDDVAKYLYEVDNSSLEGTQRIQTYTILAFQNSDPLVEQAANPSHGRGGYKNVFNSNELAEALTKMLVNIVLESDTSFVAPVVPTSPENRTYSGERVYLGFFKPISQKPWHGNLKKYGINHQNQVVDKNGVKATNDDDGSFNASAVSFWSTSEDAGTVEEGGAGEVLLNRDFSTSPRLIYTYRETDADLTASANAFNTTNITAGDLGFADDAARDKLIHYIYGYDAYDEDGDGTYGDPNNGEKLEWILGDILHSKPQIVNYNTYNFDTSSEADCNTNKTMVYVGTNDGLLHAFRDCDGGEEWAFLPPNLWPNLKELGDRPAAHTYFNDASPVVYTYDKDNDGNIGAAEAADGGDGDDGSDDKVILIFGQRRGGNAYYALDVTNPSSPEYLWKIDSTTTGFEFLGETWSEPNLGKVKFDDGGTLKEMIVAFVGGGYDSDNEDGRFGNTTSFSDTDVVTPTADTGAVTSPGSTTAASLTNSPKGRGVIAFAIATLNSGVPTIRTGSPRLIWKFTKTSSTSTHGDTAFNMNFLDYSVPSDITVLDTDYDGYIDRLYFGDIGGQVWRISDHQSVDPRRPLTNPLINTWFGKRIFGSNTAATNTADKGRKIFYRPSVTYEPGGMIALYFGTGDRAHPLNTAVVDRVYAVYDRGQRINENIDEDNLIDVTANELQLDSTDEAARTSILNNLYASSNYGWYFKLDRLNDSNAHAGEKVLAAALAFNKVAYYTTYTPNATASVDPCSPGNLGISRLYAVNYKTGEAVLNFNTTNDSANPADVANERALSKQNKTLRRADRENTLGIGIPSGLVVVMPPSGDAELLIGCGGGLCSEDPAPGGTIIPVYWMQW